MPPAQAPGNSRPLLLQRQHALHYSARHGSSSLRLPWTLMSCGVLSGVRPSQIFLLHPLQGPGPQHMLPRPPHEPRIALGLRFHAETQIQTPLFLWTVI
jgi:hypothetical protein